MALFASLIGKLRQSRQAGQSQALPVRTQKEFLARVERKFDLRDEKTRACLKKLHAKHLQNIHELVGNRKPAERNR